MHSHRPHLLAAALLAALPTLAHAQAGATDAPVELDRVSVSASTR